MELMFEVTRACNMECSHCLRGEAQSLRIKKEYITSMLEQVKKLDIGYTVAFTGGEPTLNLSAINFYIEECKRLKINHDSFYIATNGNDLGIKFIETLLKLYALSDYKEGCQVQLSNDMQHDYVRDNELELIEALSFFEKKHTDNFYYNPDRVIYEGRAKEHFSGGREQFAYPITNRDDINNTVIYVNAKGNVINGCDWSYESQDNKKELILCRVENFAEYYNSLKEVEYSY